MRRANSLSSLSPEAEYVGLSEEFKSWPSRTAKANIDIRKDDSGIAFDDSKEYDEPVSKKRKTVDHNGLKGGGFGAESAAKRKMMYYPLNTNL
ncbi:hypothetical protein Tco_1267624, partial [Tanacetum coccineum]